MLYKKFGVYFYSKLILHVKSVRNKLKNEVYSN